ncbi:MAG: hypothetical protein V2I47_00145 [Bacteroidales bacterium]|jgi:hypothetical protein|nr:hypothetical protein [Bacteroidales bacterium]
MKLKYYIFILILASIASCKPEIDEFTPDKGGADFTSYLAVGNSLTAGYANGALYMSGQENSFSNILATQFKTVGGGDFKQPLMVDNYGFGFEGITPVPKLILGPSTDCLGETSLAPVRAPVDVNMANFQSVADQGPFNNIGIPGAKTFHLLVDSMAKLNPYYARFAPDQTTAPIELTAAIDATFFTLWIGNNDILGYAASGGAADAMTPPALFENYYNMILTACIQNQPGAYDDAKGAIANIPDILSIPFFTYMSTQLPYNGLVLTADQAAGLEILYGLFGYDFTFEEGPNAFVVENSDGTWGRMTADDLFLLTIPADSMKCNGMGVANPETQMPFPIPHKYILDADEVSDVRAHIEEYNSIIYNLSIMYELAHVDAQKELAELTTGVTLDGVTLSSTFVQGNIFSLDGIHLTPMGSAFVAYKFIEAINATYSANIPQVNLTDYDAVIFP